MSTTYWLGISGSRSWSTVRTLLGQEAGRTCCMDDRGIALEQTEGVKLRT